MVVKQATASHAFIGRDSIVALVNAPRGFALQLPPGARTQTTSAGATTVLAFFRSRAAFGRELPAIVRGMRKDCRYWVVWPKKSSGVKSDLSMVSICEMAALYGLAISKLCAVDETWSAMALGVRRSR